MQRERSSSKGQSTATSRCCDNFFSAKKSQIVSLVDPHFEREQTVGRQVIRGRVDQLSNQFIALLPGGHGNWVMQNLPGKAGRSPVATWGRLATIKSNLPSVTELVRLLFDLRSVASSGLHNQIDAVRERKRMQSPVISHE